MNTDIKAYGDNKTENRKFQCYENPFFKENVDADKKLIWNKISSGEKNYKYFIGYLSDDYKIRAHM